MTHGWNFQWQRCLGISRVQGKFEGTIHPRVRTVKGVGFKRDYAKPI